MKIEKIKKMNSGKYKIELEDKNKIVTYDDVILKHNLLFDKEIDSNKINELNIDTKYYDVYNKCIKFIGRKLRSKKEIMDYLSRYNLEQKDFSRIIKDLEKINLINDVNFTKAYISDRIYLSNDGVDKIRQSLVNYGVELDIIEKEIDKIDNNIIKDKLSKLILKKIRSNHKDSSFLIRKKIYNDLINLGYSSEMINECYEMIEDNDEDRLKSEFEKLYKKMSNKEIDNNLYLKMKQKLYQKGFKLNEIDKLINEKRDSF